MYTDPRSRSKCNLSQCPSTMSWNRLILLPETSALHCFSQQLWCECLAIQKELKGCVRIPVWRGPSMSSSRTMNTSRRPLQRIFRPHCPRPHVHLRHRWPHICPCPPVPYDLAHTIVTCFSKCKTEKKIAHTYPSSLMPIGLSYSSP